VLVFLWYFAARWLREISPSTKAPSMLLFFGIIGAVALIVYVTFLGTSGPIYEFMRRFGIYFYFLGTAVAQLALAIALFRHAERSLKSLSVAMLVLCGAPFVLGILNVILKNTLPDPDFIENRIEWISALLMQGYFVVLYVAWRRTGFRISVKTGEPGR
ncbi:MAG: hypothetical protein KJP16_06530, partial [Gammaproteobacteria bacterium]|nr:hypothetical protein [Gammaproteobacteria bacterium]NNL50460.1 hypothetical protein [Woeseiaceae bacterium]